MINRATLAAAALFSAFAISAPAQAGEQSDFDRCQAALGDAAETAKLKSVRGASVKTYTFEVDVNGSETTVSCKVRRGEVVAIDGLGELQNYAAS